MKLKPYFLAALAVTVAIPANVAPVNAAVDTAVQDFQDVSKNHSAYKEIMAMREQGIISGYTDQTFKPSQAISRAHVAALFVRALELPTVRAGKEFKDVPKTSKYYEDVQTVYRAGIFDGKPDDTFGIHDNLTRAHMAKVLANAFKLERHTGYIFEDIGADHWAKDDIATLYLSGITTGDNGKYKPDAHVSRAHYAVFLYRALNPTTAPKPENPLQPNPPISKPEISKPPVSSNPFPDPHTVKIPVGWKEEKTKEYDEIIKDVVFELSPKVGSGISFGRGGYALNGFDDPELLITVESVLKDHLSGMSIDQWVADVKKAIITGDIVFAEDFSYGLYIVYVNKNGIVGQVVVVIM